MRSERSRVAVVHPPVIASLDHARRAIRPSAGRKSDFGNQTTQRLLRIGAIQAKLTINQPGDRFEQEADQVADRVMRIPDPSAGAPPRIQRMCFECEEELHRKESTSAPPTQSSIRIPGGAGRPLPDSERRFFEPRFGRDFSQLRIHTDARAAESARSVNSLAYTLGSDIVFGAGQYQPETTSSRRLLAHEIAHTIQQRGAGGAPALQRTIGDGHDLTSPRFTGDLALEAVYDNERVLKSGDKGVAVRKLQQALVDAGFSLPRFGVDGNFGPETKAAVEGFQRASGLTGANIDGIVGPTTIGWLDQRFSAEPIPAGTSAGATTGCAAIRTRNVDLVSLDGSTRNPIPDLEFANSVFNQCCVRFALAGGGSENAARTTALLGGDTDLNNTGTNCGVPSAEETGLFSGASTDFGLSSPIRVFYVASVSSGARGYSNPPLCAAAALAGLTGMAAVTNSARPRTLAHELGHIVLNTAAHPADTNNLMHPSNTATGEQLTATQCSTI